MAGAEGLAGKAQDTASRQKIPASARQLPIKARSKNFVEFSIGLKESSIFFIGILISEYQGVPLRWHFPQNEPWSGPNSKEILRP